MLCGMLFHVCTCIYFWCVSWCLSLTPDDQLMEHACAGHEVLRAQLLQIKPPADETPKELLERLDQLYHHPELQVRLPEENPAIPILYR